MKNGKDNPHGLAPLGVPLSGGPDAEEHLCDDCLAERQARVCPCCGEFFRSLNAEESFCSDCNSEHPYALLKATVDQGFVYALGLRDGTIIVFSGAVIHGAYVALELGEMVDPGEDPGPYGVFRAGDALVAVTGAPSTCPAFTFERGIEVLTSEILWCADAPWGS